MVCFGAVVFAPGTVVHKQTYYGETRPISEQFQPDALAVSGISRERHIVSPAPEEIMPHFAQWIREQSPNGHAIFVSDNLAYDWQFINYYLHRFTGGNPFGFSGRRIGDIVAGCERNVRAQWKHLRTTTHDHNPVNDAMGNVEALEQIFEKYNIKGL